MSASAAATSAASSITTSPHAALIAEFCLMVGLGDPSKNNNLEFSESFLAGHGYELAPAVDAYLEMKAEGGAAALDDAIHDGGQEEVRAPIPDKVDQLYDDTIERGLAMQRSRRRPAIPRAIIDPFRNFAEEKKPAATKQQHAKLSVLFSPPDSLIYKTADHDSSLDAACAHALDVKKWLLVNVQQADEFASHCLNRDVWNWKPIADLVRQHFIFCQPSHNTSSGQRYSQLYHPPALPSIAILDPVTRQKVWDIHEEGGREIKVDKNLRRLIEKTLKEYAARPNLTLNPTKERNKPEEEERRIMQKAIDDSLASESSPVRPLAASTAAASSTSASRAVAVTSRPTVPSTARSIVPTPNAPSKPAASSASTHSSSASYRSNTSLPSSASSIISTAPASSTVASTTASSDSAGAASAPIDVDDDEDVYLPFVDSDEEIGAKVDDKNDSDYVEEDDDDDVHILTTTTTTTKKTTTTVTATKITAPSVNAKRKRDEIIEVNEQDVEDTKRTKKVQKATASSSTSSSILSSVPADALSAPAPPSAPSLSSLLASLPHEPATSVLNVCRLQIRLPGGKPVQRRFLKSQSIQDVYTFTQSLLPSDQLLKKFLLVTTMPRRQLTDHEISIEAAGVANACVILEWTEQ